MNEDWPTSEEAAECQSRGLSLHALRRERTNAKARHARTPRQTLDRPFRDDGSRLVTYDPDQPDVSEAVEQARIIEWLEKRGWKCWKVGQKNAKKSQDPGVVDVLAFHDEHGALFCEVKKPHGGVQSKEQVAFQRAVVGAGGQYVCGSFPMVQHYLADRCC